MDRTHATHRQRRQCHFEVIAVSGEAVTLRAVLTHVDYPLAIHALDEADAWSLGWRSLPG